MQAYEASRKLLIARERELSHHHFEIPYTTKESRAVECIKALEELEIETHWTKSTPSSNLQGVDNKVWLGMPFTSSKFLMEQSKLFKLLRSFPKGCLLHCHLDAMNDPAALLRLSFAHENLGISSNVSLTENQSSKALVQFKFFPLDHQFPTSSIYSSNYVAGTMESVGNTRTSFPGGEESFDEFITKRLTVSPETVGFSPTEVWDHFGATFILSSGLLMYEPVWEKYIAQVLTICRNDNVPYLECRINFLHEFMINSSGSLSLPHRDWVRLFVKSVEAVTEDTTSSSPPFWGAKIIYSTIRFIEKGEGKSDDGFYRLRWYMEDCIQLKREFPEIIAGFDLVGWEDGLKPLSYYMEDLLWFKVRQKECGVSIPYLLHAGETLGDGGRADMNLYDAVLLDTKRIGHGFSLPQHPLLMQMCKDKKIAVECCPISNELLRYTASTGTHPLSVLLNNSVPVSLSCDDPQFFGNYGLTYDFYQVLTSSEAMDIMGLGKLARQSIQYSMLTDEEKIERTKEFDYQFQIFLDFVIEACKS